MTSELILNVVESQNDGFADAVNELRALRTSNADLRDSLQAFVNFFERTGIESVRELVDAGNASLRRDSTR